MAAGRWASTLLLITAILFLAACGGSAYNVQNPGGGNQSSVTIAFTQTPPAAISLSPTTLPNVSAAITNDATNAGVTWELAVCQSNGTNCSAQPCSNVNVTIPNEACGYLSEANDPRKTFTLHSNSGDVLIYQPPSSFPIPGNGVLIQIVAQSTAQPSVNVITGVLITAFGSVLQGTYVFHAQGSDSTFSSYPYQIAGVIYLDGNGNVTTPSGGTATDQQTINTYNLSGTLLSTTSQISGGSYFVGGDGRGTLILNTTDGSGDAITEIFSLAVNDSAEASIAEIGGSITNSGGTTSLSVSGAGMMQLQDATAATTLPSQGYAFVASGTDSAADPIVFGGVLNIDGQSSKNNPCTGAGCISGNGSLADMDISTNTALVTCTGGSAPEGMVSQSTGGAPGVVIFALNNAANCFESNAVQFTGYIVDATHIQIIESDDTSGSAGFLTAGLAAAQGAATGTFSSFSGQYVWGILGFDLNSGIPSSLTSLGVINAVAAGTVTGTTDTLFQSWTAGGTPAPFGNVQFTGAYQFETGIGRARVDFSPDPQPRFNPDIIFYLTGNGTAPLVLYASAGNPAYPALGTGIAYPQASNPQSIAFSGPYAVYFNQTNGTENDGSGEMTVTPPTSGGTGTITGTVDDFENNYLLAPNAPPLVLNDTFTPPPDAFGRLAGTFMSPGIGNGPFVEYYLIGDNSQSSANTGFFVETDVTNTSQVMLGYFAPSCDVTSSNNCQQAAAHRSRQRTTSQRGTQRPHPSPFSAGPPEGSR